MYAKTFLMISAPMVSIVSSAISLINLYIYIDRYILADLLTIGILYDTHVVAYSSDDFTKKKTICDTNNSDFAVETSATKITTPRKSSNLQGKTITSKEKNTSS